MEDNTIEVTITEIVENYHISINELNDDIRVDIDESEDPITVVISELGDQGLQGPQGKSAYEEWLALGNVGTPQDFIDSLQTTDFDDLRLIVTQDGQTTFNIFNKPKKSNLFLNDSTYFENISYQIREINNSWKLIWLNEVTLTTTDLLIIRKF